MRLRHFESLRPICPVCRTDGGRQSPLELASAARELEGVVLEGILHCGHAGCRREYPIVDGIPLLMPALRSWVGAHLLQLCQRDDLSEQLEGLLGDCCGPGSTFDTTRQQLSIYGWDHYGDLDPKRNDPDGAGSVVRVLDRALELAGPIPDGPVIDLGCATGRATFELAERLDRPVVGVDLNFAMLRLAARVLHEGRVRFPYRQVGVVFHRHEFDLRFAASKQVDFWACDAASLPFADSVSAMACGLNLVDCVASPLDALGSLRRILAPGGKAAICSPYDWSSGATPIESWIGGHSQRSEAGGASEPGLRALLTPGAHPASLDGLRIVGEQPEVAWRLRLHARSAVDYRVHLLALERAAEAEAP